MGSSLNSSTFAPTMIPWSRPRGPGLSAPGVEHCRTPRVGGRVARVVLVRSAPRLRKRRQRLFLPAPPGRTTVRSEMLTRRTACRRLLCPSCLNLRVSDTSTRCTVSQSELARISCPSCGTGRRRVHRRRFRSFHRPRHPLGDGFHFHLIHLEDHHHGIHRTFRPQHRPADRPRRKSPVRDGISREAAQEGPQERARAPRRR